MASNAMHASVSEYLLFVLVFAHGLANYYHR